MQLICDYQSPEYGFRYTHSVNSRPNMSDFKLHNHNEFQELLIFLDGDAEFRVEGTTYFLRPYDIVVTQNTEMHMICHRSPSRYERIVVSLDNNFFVKNNCEEFKEIFTSRPLGVDNLIGGDAVQKRGIAEIIGRLEGYIREQGGEAGSAVVIKSILLEFLFNLNRLSKKSKSSSRQDGQVKDIIVYINENITSELNLDIIADNFFMNKYHLCHIFKEQTGFTVNKYITYKRILLARELYAAGRTLTQASVEAGFGNYSNFYKMYMKETGVPPREGMRQN